jgi:hypothetical protein
VVKALLEKGADTASMGQNTSFYIEAGETDGSSLIYVPSICFDELRVFRFGRRISQKILTEITTA